MAQDRVDDQVDPALSHSGGLARFGDERVLDTQYRIGVAAATHRFVGVEHRFKPLAGRIPPRRTPEFWTALRAASVLLGACPSAARSASSRSSSEAVWMRLLAFGKARENRSGSRTAVLRGMWAKPGRPRPGRRTHHGRHRLLLHLGYFRALLREQRQGFGPAGRDVGWGCRPAPRSLHTSSTSSHRLAKDCARCSKPWPPGPRRSQTPIPRLHSSSPRGDSGRPWIAPVTASEPDRRGALGEKSGLWLPGAPGQSRPATTILSARPLGLVSITS